jgi:hypothetical protein
MNLLCCIFSNSFSSASELEKNMHTLRVQRRPRNKNAATVHPHTTKTAQNGTTKTAQNGTTKTARARRRPHLLMSKAVSMSPTTLLQTCTPQSAAG